MKNRPLVSAALLGLGGGLRSFAPPAALALRGRGPLAGPARFIAFGAAAGELIADKQPQMSSRLALRGLALRLGFSSSGGRDLGGWEGAGVATATALAAAFAGSRLRAKVHSRPAQLAAAAAEDALSYGLVLAAVRKLERTGTAGAVFTPRSWHMAGHLPMPSAYVLSLPGFGFSVGGRADHNQVTELVLRHLPILMAGQ